MIKPSEIKREARKYEDENMKFRRFLKSRADPDELDRQFLELHGEIFLGYDCCCCTNCCRLYETQLSEEDVASISSYLGLSRDDFIGKYIDPTSEGFYIKAPCSFLGSDGKCRIYDNMPSVCKGFPYTNKPDRLWSLLSIMSSAEICPVVFEIVRRLKKIYRFRGLDS